MLGCDFFQYTPWMGSFFSGGIFSVIFWGFITLILVLLAIRLFSSLKSRQAGPNRDRYDSLEILKVRYARGEIDQQEYTKMKSTLLQV